MRLLLRGRWRGRGRGGRVGRLLGRFRRRARVGGICFAVRRAQLRDEVVDLVPLASQRVARVVRGIVHVRDEPGAPGDGVVRHAVPGPRLRRALVDDSAPSPRGPVVDGEHHEGGERDDGREELGDATSVLDVHESHGRVQKRLRLGGAARRRTRGSHLECGVERGCWTRFYGVLRC